ncbi:site-2 protease family protein [Paenibacillus sp. FSL R7-0048]|jgi:Zn-dependent protease|uniref:Site-2 protease family protein n=1 Tax=Paenibacillus odorifer TaxID=189426 RepID=A0A1R0YZ33_9BACL|nr:MULTISPECIES: site-2 protease family protein [Paenibacillus]AWV35317.1 site-2 protease family protein [Paenibacillus odorifer]MDH6430025.1 Zn-dependent protease [Paenibacillus sp. PastH-4]MDH6445873.1 Zn-dependent protease [Paenibacillus sp. PastF-4]MDH6530656.1 Zn-dependent protease [Paenibacillus sp. PastH-3]OMC72856.1 site-2 protease family protein [Paenibacillus odorifer]
MDILQSIIRVDLDQLPFLLITILIAFTVHEFSHAYFANKFGDPTARLLGRMTLNPAVHFDFFGILLLLVAGFGWARPVPVNRDNFSRPRLMGVIVSAAGPISNLLLGIIGALIYGVLAATGVLESISNDRVLEAVYLFFGTFIQWNFFLFLFNLIPLPPLDGYRIVEDIAPRSIRGRLQQFEQWAVFIFLLILFIPGLRTYTIDPLGHWASEMSRTFVQLFLRMFGS